MTEQTSNSDRQMLVDGSSASPGLAVGKAYLYKKQKQQVRSELLNKSDISMHLNLFEKARSVIEDELKGLRKEHGDKDVKDILETQIEIVNDPELHKRVKALIQDNRRTADFAINKVFNDYLKVLSKGPNSIARPRIVDISDIRDRLIGVVLDNASMDKVKKKHILVAEELSPREVINLANKEVKALVTEGGAPTSHSAIIARSMGMPAVFGVRRAMKLIDDDEMLAVDADKGEVVIRPGEKKRQQFKEKEAERERIKARLAEICKQESKTADDHRFTLRANIEFAEELDHVNRVQAEGIGLVRTESIYLERADFMDMEKQEDFYKTILEKVHPHPVTIRLFDAGGDKVIKPSRQENNPFLGWRGIRMLLDERDLLRDQLRALLRTAEAYQGRLRILVPMVSQLEEIIELKKEVEKVRSSLSKEGKAATEELPLGVMVEVPSLAEQIGAFAPYADFFSIGTNDLTQYMLAVDRGNERIGKLFDQRHPAVWRVIHKVITTAGKEDIDVSVCGELASDPVSAACLLGMGIDDLSMTPGSIPMVKSLLVSHSWENMKKLSDKVLQCSTTGEVTRLFTNWNN